MSSNVIIWETGPVEESGRTYLASPIRNHVSIIPTKTAFMFDIRVMNKAISESGGKAADSTDLGAITDVFLDITKNNGKSYLPFG